MQPLSKGLLGVAAGVWTPKGLQPRKLPGGRPCAWVGAGSRACGHWRGEDGPEQSPGWLCLTPQGQVCLGCLAGLGGADRG